jgi:hypothetical protein
VESQEADAAKGRIRSVDVLITRNDAAPRTPTSSESLLVELLWIEIADPTR